MLKITIKKISKIIVKLVYILMFFIGALAVGSVYIGGDVDTLVFAFLATSFVVAIEGAINER